MKKIYKKLMVASFAFLCFACVVFGSNQEEIFKQDFAAHKVSTANEFEKIRNSMNSLDRYFALFAILVTFLAVFAAIMPIIYQQFIMDKILNNKVEAATKKIFSDFKNIELVTEAKNFISPVDFEEQMLREGDTNYYYKYIMALVIYCKLDDNYITPNGYSKTRLMHELIDKMFKSQGITHLEGNALKVICDKIDEFSKSQNLLPKITDDCKELIKKLYLEMNA